MKIEEIIATPSRDGNLYKFQHYFNDASFTTAFNTLLYANATEKYGTDYFGLFDKNKTLVSIIELDKRDNKFYQISYTETSANWRRQGCFRYLLLKALDKYHTILSDEHQTDEAKLAWQALLKYPSERIKFKMYDTWTHNIEPVDINEVWNDSGRYLMLATNEHVTEAMIRKSEIRDQYTKKVNRHFEGLWFGPESSNEEYDNP